MQRYNIRHNAWLYWLPLTLLGIIYVLCFWYYPYLNDDLEFRAPMAEYLANGTWASFFEGWKYSVCDRFMNDNGRLPQLVGSVMVVLPKLLMSAIMGLCLVASMYMTAKAAGVWRRNSLLTALAVVCWVLVFPWADYMFGIMFYMNYVPVSAVFLVGYYLFINNRFGSIAGAVLIGLLLGCMHEIFGGTMFCGAVSVLLLYPKYRTRRNIAFVVAVFAGILYLVFTPGTASRQHGAVLFGGFIYPFKSALYAGLLYLFLLSIVVVVSVKRWRERLDVPRVTMLAVMAVVSWLIWRTFLTGLRVSWCLNVVSVTGFVYMLSAVRVSVPSAVSRIGAVLLWCVSFVGIAVSLPWSYRLGCEIDEVKKLVDTSGGDVVFYDITEPSEVPEYTLAKPNYNAWKLWSADLERVLPTEARNFDISQAVPVGRGCLAYRFGRSIILPYEEKLVGIEYCVVLDVGGAQVDTSAFFIPFYTAKGERFMFAKFYFIPLRYCRGSIDSVEITGVLCKD